LATLLILAVMIGGSALLKKYAIPAATPAAGSQPAVSSESGTPASKILNITRIGAVATPAAASTPSTPSSPGTALQGTSKLNLKLYL
jgi:hypothetical protein